MAHQPQGLTTMQLEQVRTHARLIAREERLARDGALLDALETFAAERPPGAPVRCDEGAVVEIIREARAHPGREIRRQIANVVSADVFGDLNQPSTMPSPYSRWTAPLLDAFAVVDPMTGQRLEAEFPTGIVAGPQSAEKAQLPSVAFAVDASDNPGVNYGLALDVSLWTVEMLAQAGRAGLVAEYLLAQSRAAADRALAVTIDAQAGAAADLGAAAAAITPPFQPQLVCGNLADLLAIDAVRLAELGLRFVIDQHLTKVIIADPTAIDASIAPTGLLAEVEPQLVGMMMSSSVKLAAAVDAAGCVSVTGS